MNNHSRSESYQGALRATEQIEPPAIGFAKPSEYQGAFAGNTAIIKQNNMQIQLLFHIAESLKEIQRDLQIIIRNQAQSSDASAEVIPEALIFKLQNLSLGPSDRKKEPRGKLTVFQDPYKLLKEEQAKLKDGR